MVELAVADEPRMVCDRRELGRPGHSYTIDSLIELREELGAGHSVCLILGCDAVLNIANWHRWHELLDWCHIIVIARPGWQLPVAGVVAQWLQQHRLTARTQITQQAGGGILIEQLTPQPITATEVRQLLAAGQGAKHLLPPAVLDYIQQQKLYR